jgi:hypothetical protein
MFEPTRPADGASTDASAGLQRVSEFRRRHEGGPVVADTVSGAGSTRLSSLNPSLLQDLMRFDADARPGEGLEMLEVMAAAVRHSRALLLHVEHEHRVIPVTLFPIQRQVHAPLNLAQLLALSLPDLRVLHVEPARTDAQGPAAEMLPLGPLLWELALRGSRDALLPELAGPVAYRIAPGANLDGLELTGSLLDATTRLRRDTTSLRTMAQWPGFDRERAQRMLNGLYLQAALMISRTHPAATGDR